MRKRQQNRFLIIAAAGLVLLLWLLLSPPDSALRDGECRPVLNLSADDNASAIDDGHWRHQVLNDCVGKQNTRLSWSLLVLVPTTLSAAAAWARRPSGGSN